MHRDLELVRALLLKIADVQRPGQALPAESLALPGYDPVLVAGHLVEMHDERLIEVAEYRSLGQLTHELGSIQVMKIWPRGYDLLDSIKADTVWAATKQRLATVGGTASLEIVKQVAAHAARTMLGLA